MCHRSREYSQDKQLTHFVAHRWLLYIARPVAYLRLWISECKKRSIFIPQRVKQKFFSVLIALLYLVHLKYICTFNNVWKLNWTKRARLNKHTCLYVRKLCQHFVKLNLMTDVVLIMLYIAHSFNICVIYEKFA